MKNNLIFRLLGGQLAVTLAVAAVLGLLLVSFPEFYAELLGSGRGVLGAALIVCAGCAALSVLTLQRLLASLDNLTAATRNLSSGNRELEVAIDQDERLQRLAEALGVMALSRFRAEDALSLSDARFRQLFECAPDAILVEDSLGTILDANTAACQLYGLAYDELKGANMLSLVPVSARSRAARSFRHWFTENPKHQEGVCYTVAGNEVPVEINGAPIVYDGQQAVVLTLRDITLRKQVEQTLEEARAKAARLARLQNAFLANISHEIRTPMNGIVGLSELLKSTALNAEQREYAETISDSCDHLLGVLTNVVELAKLESGHVRIEAAPFDLRELSAGLAERYQVLAERKGLRFRFALAEGLPGRLGGDERRIRQVLGHLLDNALKFTSEGQVSFEVSPAVTSPLQTDEYAVHFSIRDTGIGMPGELQQALFGMFWQADCSPSRSYGGMGVGLALCRKIIEKMGGVLKVTSCEGDGSTFSFVLPLERAQTAAAQPCCAHVSAL